MRLHTPMMAIVISGGLALGACDKKADPGPAPATAQVSQPESPKPATPETPSEPERDREQPAAADRRGPIDRTDAIKTMMTQMEKGELGAALKYLDKGVVWTEVGLPDGELDSIEEIVAFQQRARTGFSDFKMRPSRIIEAADYQIVEFVWAANHSGAFADGTPATNKVATLPSAMLLRYQEDGLIDRVWVFQDWPNALQQLGLVTGLPDDFRAVAMPSETEVVTGRYDPLHRERYLGYMQRMTPDQYRNTISELTTDDFAAIDLHSGRLVTGKDAMTAYVGQRMGVFALESTEIESAMGAGPLFAAFVTNKLVYKGGFMGAEAKDQKITTHTLDIVEFDPASMRFKTLASYGNSYEVLAGLELTAGGAARVDGKADRFGIASCDDYVDNMRACIDAFAAPEQDAARLALDTQVVGWRKELGDLEQSRALGVTCATALVAAQEKHSGACPRVDWD